MAGLIKCDIAVIGAGVIGLAIAHRLALEGREVVLIDPDEPGMGASYGNAGTVADYAMQPVGTPSVLASLPRLLFDRNSPLAIRQAALPALAPWLVRFARQCLPAAARRNAQALANLVQDAQPRWTALADAIGGAELLQHRGCLYLYESARDLRAAKADMAFRRDLGVAVEMLGPDEIAALEPGLPPLGGGGAFFPEASFMVDPSAMVQLLAAAALAEGAGLLRGAVHTLSRGLDGLRLSGPGVQVHARRVVIAAGAHSRSLAAQAGDKIPLDTERGYHLEWDSPTPRLSRPSCPTARGFYLCPMRGRLRVAGTVELGGLSAPPSPHRIARLEAGARAFFPDLGPPSRSWMGFRPSIPDSLPVIGGSQGGPDVVHAYGHGHIGLTLAPLTAEIVADIFSGRESARDFSACLPQRF
ncbi:NAD(P)/FAD-dependent oxidoreductase [Phaeovulum sp.]|uniref:NAD(P)/FAD-dependent oxidoreductase n=1 Tax=Phaeovulum sp. TaxID=2934796 RepID=UPI0035642DF3